MVATAQLPEGGDLLPVGTVLRRETVEPFRQSLEFLRRARRREAHLLQRGELVGQKFEAEAGVFGVVPDGARGRQNQPERFEFQFALRQFPIGIGEDVAVEPGGPLRSGFEPGEVDLIGVALAIGDDGELQIFPFAVHPVNPEPSFDRLCDRAGRGEGEAELRRFEVAGIHPGEHSGAGPQVDARFAGGGGDAQLQNLLRPVGPDSGKAGQIESLTPRVEPRIDLEQNLFRSEKFPGCGNGAEKKKKDRFPDHVFLHVFLLA